MSSQGGQVLGIFGACTNGPGELVEEVGTGCRELITADEPPVVTKPLLDPIVVEDRQDGGCLPNSAGAD